jgi:putative YphP/YqiW family bacilliredoxin
MKEENLIMPPMYDPEAVRPMWEELVEVGINPLTTEDEVDAALGRGGVTLVLINSVCGCAAGNCRPGAMLALQGDKIPDQLYTVFAGVDKEATQRVRDHMGDIPPSSPNIVLFKNGKPFWAMMRHHIEQLTAVDIANELTKAFDENCTAQGPSVPKEKFEEISPVKQCGSKIPLYQGD